MRDTIAEISEAHCSLEKQTIHSSKFPQQKHSGG